MRDFLSSGRFVFGANYWASHAGMMMWRDWRPEVIDEDFRVLAALGLQVLRVFPLWPDFQPIHLLRADNRPKEFRWGEQPLPEDQRVQSGVAPEMLDRCATLCDLAAKHGLDLILGLVTGWMSGRLFAPPGLEGLNHITDDRSKMWQVRLVRTLVARFRDHPAIKAWDLGNECNVMGATATREQAWVWTALISQAVRNEDATRPIISGMHSLSADPDAGWTIRDQGELTDVLTTHPYPLFTPHCNREPLNTMRPILHGTAESCLYADLSGRPAFVEEFGNLGPMICGEAETAAYVRAVCASLWANDCRSVLWWCAHDQTALECAPYDWTVLERQLGMLREDRSPKPLVHEFAAFRQTLESLPFAVLPPRRVEAVCILTAGQDHWAVAYSAFVLAKQAGFDLRFHYGDRSLPDAPLYLLPSISSTSTMSRRLENELWQKVRAGATAYVSLADGMLGHFNEAAGVEVQTRSQRSGECTATLPSGAEVRLKAPLQYEMQARTAEVLANEKDGRPFFLRNRLGEGEVFVLCAPLEAEVAGMPQTFVEDNPPPFWEIYRAVAEKPLAGRVARKKNPWLGITEHAFPDGSLAVVIINYSRQAAEDTLHLPDGWEAKGSATPQEVVSASPGCFRVQLPPNGYTVWQIKPAAA